MTTVFELLEQEWPRFAAGSRARTDIARWDDRRLASFDDLDDLVCHVRKAAPAEADEVLAALARLAPTDVDAARTLLHLLLPGCKALCRRLPGYDPEERAASVVAAAWSRIRTYPIDRRPRAVAANVLLDTAKAARVALAPLPLAPVEEPRVHPGVEVLALVADAVEAGVIERDAAVLVLQTRLGDRSIDDIAAERRCHPGSLRRRRRTAERALEAVA